MRAARWVAASRFVLEILGLTTSILLAHLLTPAEIGRAVIALAVMPLSALLLGDIIGPLLVQRDQLTNRHIEAASAASIAGAFLFAGLCLVAAPFFAWLIDPQTGWLVALASLAFLATGIGVTPDALLRRWLDFRSLSVIEVAAALSGTAVTLGLALADVGPSALIWGSLTGNLLGSVAVIRIVGFPRPCWHRAEGREILSFGTPAGLSALGELFYLRVDYVIVGARLNAASVGAYWRAYQLGADYQAKITQVMLRVAFPLYSRLPNLEELRQVRSRIVRLHAVLVVPALAVLIAVAPVLIPFVYGEAWRQAILPTQLLAMVGMLNALITGVGPLLMAVGKARLLNWFTWPVGIGYAIVVFIAAPSGIVAVSAAALGYVIV